MKKIARIIFSSSIVSLFMINPVLAQEVPIPISKPPILKPTDPGKLIGATIGLLLVVSTLASFIFLIWGGVQWITSGGDKAGVEAAQHRIQAALLGLFIVFSSWAIMTVFGQFLGVDISNLKIPTPF
ncbi:hypothetical protein HZB96_02130 [Candidatus Gottesmanbacteria bacterium]|nr:hypothetical protein [Candidatus Gottesmanbacteria bacterium]MBI5451968.1 hypothetical protein [Candidatus Gottesmanbacteria bacterium]